MNNKRTRIGQFESNQQRLEGKIIHSFKVILQYQHHSQPIPLHLELNKSSQVEHHLRNLKVALLGNLSIHPTKNVVKIIEVGVQLIDQSDIDVERQTINLGTSLSRRWEERIFSLSSVHYFSSSVRLPSPEVGHIIQNRWRSASQIVLCYTVSLLDQELPIFSHLIAPHFSPRCLCVIRFRVYPLFCEPTYCYKFWCKSRDFFNVYSIG